VVHTVSIIDAGNTYQAINNMINYPTLGTTLLNNYNTQTTTASILTNYPTLGTTLLK
jgi:hypothetical protein